MRRSSYQYSILNELEAPRIAAGLYPIVKDLWKEIEESHLHPAIFCSRILIQFNQLRFGSKWKGGGVPQFLENKLPTNPLVCIPEELILWTRVTLRGIPWSVNRSLVLWWMGEYRLRLFSYVPSATEVLDQQCKGFRCVTFFKKLEELATMVEGERDAFSFLIHDLIHADHFFSDPGLREQQIQFYQQVSRLMSDKEIQKLYSTDQVFVKDLNYIVSDMNSHPDHLRLSWKAMILNAFKRRNGVSLQQRLDGEQEMEFNEWRKQFLLPRNEVIRGPGG